MSFDDIADIPVHKTVAYEKIALGQIIDLWERYKGNMHLRPSYEEVFESTAGIRMSPAALQQYLEMCMEGILERTSGVIPGKFTGALLHRIAEQRPDEVVVVDGKDRAFDCLFYCAQKTPLTVIRNLRGNSICARVANARLTLIDVRGQDLTHDASDTTIVRIRGSRVSHPGPNTSALVYGGRWGVRKGNQLRGAHYDSSCMRQYPGRWQRRLTAHDLHVLDLLRRCEHDPVSTSKELHEIAEGYL